jgi:hypothetical protein
MTIMYACCLRYLSMLLLTSIDIQNCPPCLTYPPKNWSLLNLELQKSLTTGCVPATSSSIRTHKDTFKQLQSPYWACGMDQVLAPLRPWDDFPSLRQIKVSSLQSLTNKCMGIWLCLFLFCATRAHDLIWYPQTCDFKKPMGGMGGGAADTWWMGRGSTGDLDFRPLTIETDHLIRIVAD